MSAGTALVTGGAGFIGRHLTARLCAGGWRVRVLDPRATALGLPQGADAVAGSVLDPETVARAIAGADEVYHLAALAHLWARDRTAFARINVEGTRTVLKAARRAETPSVVVVSSEAVLRDWRRPQAVPLTAEAPLPPLSAMPGPYARSKHQADRLAREAAAEGAPVRLVYPTAPLGAGDWQLTAPTRMIRDFLVKPPPMVLDARLDFVPVADVAAGCCLAARRGRPGGRYLLAGETWGLCDLLALLQELSGRSMPQRRVSYALAWIGGLAGEIWGGLSGSMPPATLEGVRLARCDWSFDAGPTRRALGWEPGPVRAALAETVAWLERCGFLPQGLIRKS